MNTCPGRGLYGHAVDMRDKAVIDPDLPAVDGSRPLSERVAGCRWNKAVMGALGRGEWVAPPERFIHRPCGKADFRTFGSSYRRQGRVLNADSINKDARPSLERRIH